MELLVFWFMFASLFVFWSHHETFLRILALVKLIQINFHQFQLIPLISIICIIFTSIEACLFKHPFYRGNHSKGIKKRALHVHQRKTKYFIAKLFAQPYMPLNTLSILVIIFHSKVTVSNMKSFQRLLCFSEIKLL